MIQKFIYLSAVIFVISLDITEGEFWMFNKENW